MHEDNPAEEFRPLVESLEAAGIFEQVAADHRRMLEADPEWTEPGYIHVHTLLTAFVHGILTADPWHEGYTVPPGFEGVVNWVAGRIQAEFRECEVPELTLLEIEDMYRRWCDQNLMIQAWNEAPTGASVGIVCRHTQTAKERDFIDLHALTRNAVVFIRNERRRDNASDASLTKLTEGDADANA